jgi:sugar O-acyltransferase (sialic acid O-acetyltransferase NeuD family)
LNGERLRELPVVDFAEVARHYPPAGHAMLLPIGPIRANALRAERLAAARARGYRIASHVSSRALVWGDFELHENVLIYDGAIVQPFARIGENTIVRSGAHVSHHVEIGANGFIAAGACIGGGAILESNCFVGLNATIRDGVRIASGCTIGAGAVVVSDTEPDGVYVGVPARRQGSSSISSSSGSK